MPFRQDLKRLLLLSILLLSLIILTDYVGLRNKTGYAVCQIINSVYVGKLINSKKNVYLD